VRKNQLTVFICLHFFGTSQNSTSKETGILDNYWEKTFIPSWRILKFKTYRSLEKKATANIWKFIKITQLIWVQVEPSPLFCLWI